MNVLGFVFFFKQKKGEKQKHLMPSSQNIQDRYILADHSVVSVGVQKIIEVSNLQYTRFTSSDKSPIASVNEN